MAILICVCILLNILVYKDLKIFTHGKLTMLWCAPEFIYIATAFYCALYVFEGGNLCAMFDQAMYLKLYLMGNVDYSKRIVQETIRFALTQCNHNS